MGKTVTPPQNFAAASGFKAAEPVGTPEERRALDELFSMAYDELRRVGSSVKRNDPRGTLNPTALVNEAWLKLGSSRRLQRGNLDLAVADFTRGENIWKAA
jgi:hypothetical protein